MKQSEKLDLKRRAQGGDYQSTVALLSVNIAEAIEKCITQADDHRYNQGKVHALKALYDDIVRRDS